MRAELTFFWRSHLAVALAAAVATAAATGALVVGDSVRGSLVTIASERLGAVDDVLVADRLVRQALATNLESELGGEAAVAPVLLLPGSAVHGDSGARAARVTMIGIDASFARLYPGSPVPDLERRAGQALPSVLLNESLARELGARPGDEVLLSFGELSAMPRETLVGRSEGLEDLTSMRLAVAEVVPDRGWGGLSLAAQQASVLNAFIDLGRLQRVLDTSNQVNALLVHRPPTADDGAVAAALDRRLRFEDFGLTLRTAADTKIVESRRFVLEPPLVAAVETLAREQGWGVQPISTYLANRIAIGERSLPYSTVAALDPTTTAAGQLFGEDGALLPALAEGEIALNTWAAQDLSARVGDAVSLTYYELGERDELREKTVALRLAAIARLEGLGADPTLTPEFPGMSDTENMADWHPPFPVDLEHIRPQDEAYWDQHRGAPKAFVSLAQGRALFRSRFGDLTSLRLTPPVGTTLMSLEGQLEQGLPDRLAPAAAGIAIQPIRQRALTAAAGATDFAQLFLGFSWFLIASAALLTALLFRLAVEQRAKEAGLLLATGYPRARVRRRFLAEGGVVASLGVALGLLGGVGYAAAMLWGLRTWWLPAVGTPLLALHVRPLTLVAGGAIALAVVLLSIVLGLRSLWRVPAPALLAGATAADHGARRKSRARAVMWVALGLALALLVLAVAGVGSAAGLAFGVGASLLVAGLAAFASWCRREGSRRDGLFGRRGLWSLGARNTARNAGRSLVSVALVASASFLLVAVGAQRGSGELDVMDRAGGAGGFPLLAESDVPLYGDLASAETRSDLGISSTAAQILDRAKVLPLRLLPGDDASCLNLFRPQKPRVLGVPPELVQRGGFTFLATSRETDSPWTLLDEELGSDVVPAFADANSAQWILKLGLGDELTLQDGHGQPVRLRLVGLLAKSIFQSELLISGREFERHFSDQTGYRYFLVDSTAADAPAVSQALESALGRFGFDVTPTAERLAAFQAVESTYLSTFQTLGGLGLLLGTLGLGLVLVRNVLERRGELAALAAFGFSRSRLSALVLAENVVLLLTGVGLGSAAALVAVAPHLAAHATHVPWLSLIATLAVVIAAGILASLAGVRAARSVPLLPALRGR